MFASCNTDPGNENGNGNGNGYENGNGYDDTWDTDDEPGGFGFSAHIVYHEDSLLLVEQTEYDLLMEGPFGTIIYNLDTGFARFFRPDEQASVLRKVYAETTVNGELITTYNMFREEGSVAVSILDDMFGSGLRVSVTNTNGLYTIVQNYDIYPLRSYILLSVELQSDTGPVSTNYISVIKAGKDGEYDSVLALRQASDPRFLFVPFDNDDFIRYDARRLFTVQPDESYEVTAVYDNTGRRGFVTGSVTHDTWKTGIRTGKALVLENNIPVRAVVSRFNVFAGITSRHTRDINAFNNNVLAPHGMVSGDTVNSPRMYFGFCADWRDGMEEFGRANGLVAPPLRWDNGVPFGWNSWGAHADNINYNRYVAASDFIRDNLPDFHNGDDPVYVNFDSYWDRLNETNRRNAATHVRNNGQIPGIYRTPFTAWHGSVNQLRNNRPPGTDYTYYDIVLKDMDGNPMRYMNNMGWPLDPTHPGTTEYNINRINAFRDWGFSFVKLDFLSHGTMEGDFYNKSITTGIQAYNYGMAKFLEAIGTTDSGIKRTDNEFFVSLSIAPIFPSQYAHSRRLSCDVFGTMADAEYLLNSLTYGWWINNTVYPFNDPDHIIVYKSYNQRVSRRTEGMARYIAAAITGGLMLYSDDMTVADARQRVADILNNQEVNQLASSSRTFRPVEGNTGTAAANLFVRDDRDIDGYFYLAYFNFSTNAHSVTVDLARIGLDPAKTYAVWDMLAGFALGNTGAAEGAAYTFDVAGEETILLRMWETQ